MSLNPLRNNFTHIGLSSGTIDDGADIDSRHPDYVANVERYNLINTELGGSTSMRNAGTTYLPKFDKETDAAYIFRKNRTYLNPSFSVAIESHASKPFSKPVVVENHSDDSRLGSLVENTDGQGNDVTEFAKRLFTDADSYGMTHVLSDYSVSDAVSLADELASGAGATLVHIRCLDLFYWDAKIVNGKHVLTEIRYHREATIANGEFGKRQAKQIVRWTRDNWELWQEKEESDEAANRQEKDQSKLDGNTSNWEIVELGENKLGSIPLTTIYFKRTGFMQAEPPNYELAEVVLEHYQDMSDQKNLESVARVGMLTAVGFEDSETANISIGPRQLIQSANTEAKLAVVEHSGSAVSIGRNSLKILEDKMEELSLKPELNRTSGDVTASEVLSNAFNSSSELLYWTLAVEQGLIQAFKLAYQWIGAELADDFKLKVYDDFTVVGNVSDLPVLLDAKREGVLDSTTLLFEMKRRGSIDVSHDISSIVEASKKEQEDKMKNTIELANATKPEPAAPKGDNNESNNS